MGLFTRRQESQEKMRLLESKLKESEARSNDFLRIIEKLDQQVFCCQKNEDEEIIITLNAGQLGEPKTCGLEPGMRLEDLIGAELFKQLKPHYDKAFAGEEVKFGGFLNQDLYHSTILTPLKFHPDGSVLEILGSSQDITEFVKSKAEMRQTAEMLKKIIEYNPYSIQLLDAGGHHLSGNKAYLDLFLFQPPPEWSIFNDPFLKNIYGERLFTVLEGEIIVVPPTWYNGHFIDASFPDNPICIGSVMFPILKSDGTLEYIVIMHEDITVRIRAEEELIQAKEKAEVADRLEICLSGQHEPRNPHPDEWDSWFCRPFKKPKPQQRKPP
jgi:PAS domain-containing protein